MSAAVHPWLTDHWQNLQRARSGGRLPHGLLLTGAAGLGKLAFARRLAESLLCGSPTADAEPCGQCSQCQLLAAGSHPDLLVVQPAEEGKGLLIDQIRGLCRELSLKSHAGGYKIAILEPAERMNVAAANSLLKTLEEPTDNTLLMLVTSQPAPLPATIRSRCQQLAFPLPGREAARAWLTERLPADQDADLLLDLADGAPLRALAMADGDLLARRQERLAQLQGIQAGRQDPLAVAAEWAREKDSLTLQWLHGWLTDMIKISSTGQELGIRNSDLAKVLRAMADSLDCQRLYRHSDRVLQALRLGSTGVNRQLMMEDLLLAWSPAAKD